MDTIIEVKNATKIYRLYDRPSDRLKETLDRKHRIRHRDFYALNDVSFHVDRGESVGIIGTNGSGKSTMLKIITGVLKETAGTVSVTGTVSALLELGAGFNPEYTGIENVYMNGTMMGYSRKEMDEKLPSILEFADIGEFVHQPVKSYSSGMFVRLAFALAINVEPEILVVDEALSVGDIFFQAKCYHRMDELKKKGTTILMVTHDMGAVMKYCDRVVLLNAGQKVAEGRPGEMVDLYKKILAGQYEEQDTAEPDSGMKEAAAPGAKGEERTLTEENASAGDLKEAPAAGTGKPDSPGKGAAQTELMRTRMNVNPNVNGYGNHKAEIYDFGILDKNGNVTSLVMKGETFTIKERIRFLQRVEAPIFTFTFRDKKGTDLTGTNTLFEGKTAGPALPGDEYEVSFTQRMTLQGGEYLLSMSCTGFEEGEHTVYHRMYDLLNVTVLSNKNTVGVYDMESETHIEKTAVERTHAADRETEE